MKTTAVSEEDKPTQDAMEERPISSIFKKSVISSRYAKLMRTVPSNCTSSSYCDAKSTAYSKCDTADPVWHARMIKTYEEDVDHGGQAKNADPMDVKPTLDAIEVLQGVDDCRANDNQTNFSRKLSLQL